MNTFIQEYEIRAQEIDYQYRLKPHLMSAFFQNSFACELTDLGIAAFDLQRQHKSWAIADTHVEFYDKLPFWRTKITVESWNSKTQGLKLFRDFKAYLPDGKLIAAGSSTWFIFDEIKRRPEKLDFVLDKIQMNDEDAIQNFVFQKIKPIDGEHYHDEQKIRSWDLDFNGHVNSMRYIGGALETIPLEYRKQHQIKSYTIRYSRETKYGEQVFSNAFHSNNRFYHILTKNIENEEICRMKSEWI